MIGNHHFIENLVKEVVVQTCDSAEIPGEARTEVFSRPNPA